MMIVTILKVFVIYLFNIVTATHVYANMQEMRKVQKNNFQQV